MLDTLRVIIFSYGHSNIDLNSIANQLEKELEFPRPKAAMLVIELHSIDQSSTSALTHNIVIPSLETDLLLNFILV